MKKIIPIFLYSVVILSAATPEQVERYLLISGSEDQLISFEQQIDSMGQLFAARGGSDLPLMQDSQMIPIRFREYLQQHLSENEMDEILETYSHDVMRKLVSAEVLMEEPDTLEAYRQFMHQIQGDPLPANRTEAIKSIIKNLYDEKQLIAFFEKMFLPMIQKMGEASGRKMDENQIKELGKRFVEQMRQSNYDTMLFMTRDFTQEEIEELETLSQSSASRHEVNAVFGGITYALEEAMQNMAKRLGQMVRARRHPAMQTGNVNEAQKQNNADRSGGERQTIPAK